MEEDVFDIREFSKELKKIAEDLEADFFSDEEDSNAEGNEDNDNDDIDDIDEDECNDLESEDAEYTRIKKNYENDDDINDRKYIESEVNDDFYRLLSGFDVNFDDKYKEVGIDSFDLDISQEKEFLKEDSYFSSEPVIEEENYDYENKNYSSNDAEITIVKYKDPVFIGYSRNPVLQEIDIKNTGEEDLNGYELTMRTQDMTNTKAEYVEEFDAMYFTEFNGIKDGENGLYWEICIRDELTGEWKVADKSPDKLKEKEYKWFLKKEDNGSCGGCISPEDLDRLKNNDYMKNPLKKNGLPDYTRSLKPLYPLAA